MESLRASIPFYQDLNSALLQTRICRFGKVEAAGFAELAAFLWELCI